MAKSVIGTCHICGVTAKLSFEHVPPEAAFNDRRILRTSFEKILASVSLDELPGKLQQRGAGEYTLCERCNSNTGSWYGSAYARWAHQAMRYIYLAKGRPSLSYPYNLFPLRVLKQIVCMFFSVNGPLFQQHQTDLVKFVLDRYSKAFPKHVRVYAFYTFVNRSRAVAAAGLLSGLGSGNSTVHVFSEVTFPPFGFVMTLGNTPPPQPDFCDISGFSKFEYNDWRAGITMTMPLKAIYTGYPGDYRPRAQVIAEYEESIRLEFERAGISWPVPS
jgi:hypothetical protein